MSTHSKIDLSRRQFLTRKKMVGQPILPWVKEAEFIDLCTQCGECIKQCPPQIIKVSDGKYPRVNFDYGECTFCYQCAQACPEPLFNLKTEPAWQASAQIADTCLAKKNIDCRTCSDACAPFAIQFEWQIGQVAQPKITADCNGCGACVSVCPTSAITVIQTK